MKEWNDENKPEDIDDLLNPLLQAIERYENSEEIKTDEMYNIAARERTTSLTPHDVFKQTRIDYKKNEGDYNFFQDVLLLAFLYGIEQQRRIYDTYERKYDNFKILSENNKIEEAINSLKENS